ncbi:hypothetical protein CDD81_5690 [Ophiocordyceps australis]|uniref:C2H2-type domain-containing protein n=1 Tax=Ophiocordyceps australis TaxID=1399860 RepID=A0A2C5XI91_9HYPO|nr:hypothetical protein CDD81_5690 [Ophiocordyceps australis]
MASTKELQPSSRPLTLQRPSLSTSAALAAGLPGRQSHARANSHSLLAGSFNASHRVTRRKSMTNSGHAVAALAAAVTQGGGEPSAAMPILGGRRIVSSKRFGNLPSPPSSLPSHKMTTDVKESAIDDEVQDASGEEGPLQARSRRASDGQPPTGKESKRSNRVEVRCEKCGKGYKHSSCLTKHLWEHTPEWSYTSKLLISKHQQVQLLEAASVLVAMNGKDNTTTPPESAKDSASEPDSASPAASGYSDQGDFASSADTTPPPMPEGAILGALSYRDTSHNGGGLYPSLEPGALKPHFSSDAVSDAPPLAPFQLAALEHRPPSSGANRTGQDDRDLAAAVELLSCSFNSNNGSQSTMMLPANAPPVPPVPLHYLDQAASLASAGFINSFPSRQPESFTRGELRLHSEDVKMEDSGDDDDFDMQSRARSDEDDDGVFGRMEE